MDDEKIFDLEREVFPHYCKDGEIQCADPYHHHKKDPAYLRDIEVLSISRIDGDKFRPKFCRNVKLLKDLKRKNYPEGYQVLCENCQAMKMFRMWGRHYW
jgi:hypothetical protein